MRYIVVKCKFDKYSQIIKEIGFDLEPMTLKEAQTFKSKMMQPSNYLIKPHQTTLI